MVNHANRVMPAHHPEPENPISLELIAVSADDVPPCRVVATVEGVGASLMLSSGG